MIAQSQGQRQGDRAVSYPASSEQRLGMGTGCLAEKSQSFPKKGSKGMVVSKDNRISQVGKSAV